MITNLVYAWSFGRNENILESQFVWRRYHIKEVVVESTGCALSEEKLKHHYDKWCHKEEKPNKYDNFAGILKKRKWLLEFIWCPISFFKQNKYNFDWPENNMIQTKQNITISYEQNNHFHIGKS